MVAPDTDTFLYHDNHISLWWFTVFFHVVIIAVLAGFWAFTNYSEDEKQTRTGTTLFFTLTFLPSILSNIVRLLEQAKPNIGPSGVEYSIVGMVAGFSLVNGFPASRGGLWKNLDSTRLVTLIALVEFFVGALILAFSFFTPLGVLLGLLPRTSCGLLDAHLGVLLYRHGTRNLGPNCSPLRPAPRSPETTFADPFPLRWRESLLRRGTFHLVYYPGIANCSPISSVDIQDRDERNDFSKTLTARSSSFMSTMASHDLTSSPAQSG